MKTILITTELNPEEKVRIAQIAEGHDIIYKDRKEVTEADMQKANLIFGNISLRFFADTPNLEWVQLQTAGTDGYLKPGVLKEDVILTNVSGAFGESIAEYVLGGVLALNNHFHHYIRTQSQKKWEKIPVFNLKASTVLVLGLGDIGKEVAKRMKFMGCKVIAVKRRPSEKPDYVDELYYTKDFDQLLPKADILVLTIPIYEAVRHIISAERISLLKEGAVFVNIARGGLVEEEALTQALESGKLRGAVLDVFEQEPLPAESRLWELPNVIISPHNAGGFRSPMARERIGQIMIENLERYLKGEPLVNVIDKETGYCL